MVKQSDNRDIIDFDHISSIVALNNAWRKFSRGKMGRADTQAYAANLNANLQQLHQELTSGTYQHGRYEPFLICDPKRRQIHKASVRDRVVHQAIVSAIERPFEQAFIHDSYSCRVGKGTHAGVRRLRQMLRRASRNNTRQVFAVKCDVQKYFASIDHEIFLRLIERRISDEQVLELVREVLLSHGAEIGRGIPLGNVTSQLFANIHLHELDRFVKHRLGIKFYLRYCDDFVIISPDRWYLESVVERIRVFLRGELKLKLHPDKIIVRAFSQGVDFLGYVVKPGVILLRTKTKNRALARVDKFNIQSYLGLCKHASCFELSDLLKTIAWG